MVGARPIATLAGSSTEEIACNTLYPAVAEDVMSRYRWRFASKIVLLELLGDAPLSRFDSKYQLPTEAARGEVYAVLVNDTSINFDRYENHIYTDAGPEESVYAEVKIMPDETYWPAYFNALVELELAAKLAVTIAEDTQKAAYLTAQALRQFGLAKSLDSQMRTARKMPVGGLRRWHRGRP